MSGLILSKVRNMKIRYKIIMVFMAIFLSLMMGALAIINYSFYNSSIMAIVQNIESEKYMFEERFGYVYDNIDQCMDISTKDVNQIYDKYDIYPEAEVEYVEFRTGIYSALYYNIGAYKGIEVFAYLDQHERLVTNGSDLDFSKEMVHYIEEDLVKDKITAKSTFFMCEPGILTQQDDQTMWMIKRVISMTTGETLGYLLMGFDTDMLLAVFPDTYEYYYDQRYSLVNQQYQVVLTQEENEMIYTEEFLLDLLSEEVEQGAYTLLGEENIMMTQYLEKYDAYLLTRISYQNLTEDVQGTTTLFIWMGIILMMLGIALIYVVSGRITRPILNLTRVAKLIQGEDYSQRCPVEGLDEVGILADTFNGMTETIKMQMESIREKQDTITKYQLDILNEQIKPHFLYNTLAAIHVLSQMGDNENAAITAKELSNFYRLCLSSGNYMVTWQDEVANIRSYINIQQMRYQDVVQFEICIDNTMANCKMLKLTLQPLVENALYHGVKEKGDQGLVRVRGYQKNTHLMFKVIDNGVGMDKEELENLKRNGFKKGYALFNVNERIRLQFGDAYGLDMRSKKGLGTVAIVRIPMEEI